MRSLAIFSNSEHTLQIRLISPVGSSNFERKSINDPINLRSDLVRGSVGVSIIFAKSIINADTGKYNTRLNIVSKLWFEEGIVETYQTNEMSVVGMHLIKRIEARAAALHKAAEENTRGFKGWKISRTEDLFVQ